MARLTFCTFASGSSGNCAYLATDETRILIDAGISTRRIEAHLREQGCGLDQLHGVCITHEHTDHIQALPVLQRKCGVPLYANAGTVQSIARNPKFLDLRWNIFTNGQTFEIGDLVLQPYSIPHDAYDPVGYIIRWRDIKIGFATDIGLPTHLIKQQLKGCHVLLLEANHDTLMLQEAPRPWSLKQRIAGRQGHLSNQQAADMLIEIAGPELQRVYLGHLSAECNSPNIAHATLRRALDAAKLHHIDLQLTHPDQASACWTMEI